MHLVYYCFLTITCFHAVFMLSAASSSQTAPQHVYPIGTSESVFNIVWVCSSFHFTYSSCSIFAGICLMSCNLYDKLICVKMPYSLMGYYISLDNFSSNLLAISKLSFNGQHSSKINVKNICEKTSVKQQQHLSLLFLSCSICIAAMSNLSEFTHHFLCSTISQNNITWADVLLINYAEATGRVILIIKSIWTENQAQPHCSYTVQHLNWLGL